LKGYEPPSTLEIPADWMIARGQTLLSRNLTYLLINVKAKVKFTLKQATKAQRGSRGITLLFL